MDQGAPYRPTVWSLGGRPTKSVDVPITAVFLALFIIGAATHMTIFQLNRRRNHKFLFNAVLFGFCMSRIVTCTIRIASICLPNDLSLSIAAAIFVAAGVLLIFIINLLWAQRILRSLHPNFGWHRAVSTAFKVLYVLIGLTLAITITSVVQNFYTLRPRTKKIDRSLQLYGQTFLAVISSLPILITLAALAVPRRSPHDKFGAGRFRTKVAVLLTGASLVTLGAWYRCGTSWQTPVPNSQPLPGYFAKACFYMFNFGVEIMTVYIYAIMRVDRRFHIPNGARGPRSYERQPELSEGGENEKEVEEGRRDSQRADVI